MPRARRLALDHRPARRQIVCLRYVAGSAVDVLSRHVRRRAPVGVPARPRFPPFGPTGRDRLDRSSVRAAVAGHSCCRSDPGLEKGGQRYLDENGPMVTRVLSWILAVVAYLALLTDRLPGGDEDPVRFEVER